MKVTLKIHSRFRGKLVRKMKDALADTMIAGVSKAVELLSRVADAKLTRTARTYKAALPDSVTATANRLSIELTGLAKDLEVGYPARDMKLALLYSGNAKTSAKGVRYVDVPFRHALEQNAVRYQGMPSEIKSRVQAAIRAERSEAVAEGRDERNPLRVTGRLPAASAKHTTSIYSDMVKTQKSAGSRKTSTYQTIRRVSESSDRKAWWHPGFQGIHAIRQTKSQLARVLQQIFKRELTKRGLRTK